MSVLRKRSSLLGTVDAGGVVRFSSDSVQDCRDFLRRAGLDLELRREHGSVSVCWRGCGTRGLIDRDKGRWHAAFWMVEEKSNELEECATK